ncbi:FtsX-like permease family protein [Symbiobacterium terraclitae]|uniref:FtsX-like permease family protein n=1 Tax=Symbiobacterium terraclitae TaxID=557451 RepID=UPI0035B55988
MSLWQIAARNVWRNRGRYVAYLVSAAFAVMIYFIYTALALHPDLQGGYPGAQGVTEGIRSASVVIAGITFIFLMTSNAAFTRSRKKEFGLWSLMGVTRGQLMAVVFWESLFIGAAALAIGLSFGVLFLRLFFMPISVLLRLPEMLPVYAGPAVWLQTLGVFGAFFLFVSLYSLVDILRSTVIELIRAERKPKSEPTFRWWKALLGLMLVVVGYAWASAPWPTAIILGVFPVTVMVSLGTVFLMQESSIALLGWLRRRKGFYYRTTPLLTVSHLRFKLQENARVLANTAITIAVILTAVSTIYTVLVVFAHEVLTRNPHAFQLVEPAAGASMADGVEAELRRQGVAGWVRHDLVTVSGELDDATHVLLVPHSLYAGVRRASELVRPLPDGSDGALVIYPYTNFDPGWQDQVPVPRELTVGGRTYWLSALPDWSGLPVNATGEARTSLVLPDPLFEQVVAGSAPEQRLRVTIWDVDAWRTREAAAAADALALRFADAAEVGRHFSSTIPEYQDTISAWGLTLFVGVFVSLVFFVTGCSVLYFRLFTEIDEDRRYFRRLQHLGVSLAELRRVSLRQTQVIFFAPFLVGLVHSTFAMKALGTLVQRPVLHYGWTVALGYLGLYALFYAVTYAVYWRTLSGGNARVA